MAIETINNGESGLDVREKINNNFTELYNAPAVALIDASTIDLPGSKHTLSSSSSTRTFTISNPGDEIILEVTLANTAATYTFPATAKCISQGIASGNNILSISGVSGDVYMIGIIKVGSAYTVVSINTGQ